MRIPRALPIGLCLVGLGCAPRSPCGPVPSGWTERLRAVGETELATRIAQRRLCIDDTTAEPGVTPSGDILLPRALVVTARSHPATASELLARVGHLALHPPGFGRLDAADRADCTTWVARLLRAEAAALQVERRVGRALGAPIPEAATDQHLAQLAVAYRARCVRPEP